MEATENSAAGRTCRPRSTLTFPHDRSAPLPEVTLSAGFGGRKVSVQQGLHSMTLENAAVAIASAGTGPFLPGLFLSAPHLGPTPASGTPGAEGGHAGWTSHLCLQIPTSALAWCRRPEMHGSFSTCRSDPLAPPRRKAHRTSQPHKPNCIEDTWLWLAQTRLCEWNLLSSRDLPGSAPGAGPPVPGLSCRLPGGLCHSRQCRPHPHQPLSSF